MDKNIQMTQRNADNTGWDDLFPKTKDENVIGLAEALATAEANAIRFAKSHGLGETDNTLNGNLNDLQVNGLFYASNNTTNKPSGVNGGYVISQVHPTSRTTYRSQLFINYNATEMYMRICTGGTWWAWKKFAFA